MNLETLQAQSISRLVQAREQERAEILCQATAGHKPLTSFELQLLEATYDAQIGKCKHLIDRDLYAAQADLAKVAKEPSKSTLSQAIQKLVTQELLKRVVDLPELDRRAGWVRLTPDGEELIYRLHEIDRLLIPKTLAMLDPDDRAIKDAREQLASPDTTQITRAVQAILESAIRKAWELDSPDDAVWAGKKADVARTYHHLGGGAGLTFFAERTIAKRLIKKHPAMLPAFRAHRSFIRRTAICLAKEFNCRNFVDLGCGLLCNGSTSAVLEMVLPDESFKVLCVDNNEYVLRANELILGPEQTSTRLLKADVTEAASILDAAKKWMTGHIAILAIGIWYFVEDYDKVLKASRTFEKGLPQHSIMAISHLLKDCIPPDMLQDYCHAVGQVYPRSEEDVRALFGKLTLMPSTKGDQGAELVSTSAWRSDIEDPFLFGKTPEPGNAKRSMVLVGAAIKT